MLRAAAPVRTLLAAALVVGIVAGHVAPVRSEALTRPAGLRVGAAVVDLPAPIGAPLSLFGAPTPRVAEGVLDPPQARALVADDGLVRIAIVSLDLVIVRPGIREAIAEQTRDLHLDALLVVATHTHSGPGGYVQGWLAERVIAGPYDAAVPGRLAAAAVEAVHGAAAALTPARLAVGTGRLELATNRRHPDGPRETALPVLEATTPDGRRIARLFSYGVHPVALGPANHLYSADLVGVARATLDGDGGISIFLPGPLGDQNPCNAHDAQRPKDAAAQRANARAFGLRLAEAVRQVETTPSDGVMLAAREGWRDVPPIELSRGSILWWFTPFTTPWVEAFLPKRTLFQALRLGDACVLAFPAEPATTLGEAARHLAPAGCTPFVIAHANDWLGYAVTADDYAYGGYEVGLSVFGPGFGGWLLDGLAPLARALALPDAETGTVAR